MYDIYLYRTVKDYMHAYKHYLNDSERHVEIDGIYITNDKPQKLIIATKNIHRNKIRPRLDASIAIIDTPDIALHCDLNTLTIVPSNQVFFLPSDKSLGMIQYRKWIFFTRYKYKLHLHRTKGVYCPEDSKSPISHNWYFDRVGKKINFVMHQ